MSTAQINAINNSSQQNEQNTRKTPRPQQQSATVSCTDGKCSSLVYTSVNGAKTGQHTLNAVPNTGKLAPVQSGMYCYCRTAECYGILHRREVYTTSVNGANKRNQQQQSAKRVV